MIVNVIMLVIKAERVAENKEELINTSREYFSVIKFLMDRRGILSACVQSRTIDLFVTRPVSF
jgi:hypothetical protein